MYWSVLFLWFDVWFCFVDFVLLGFYLYLLNFGVVEIGWGEFGNDGFDVSDVILGRW